MTERNENWQGMNWIRQEKRLAIYMRDGLACVYCEAALEDGTQLTLDHIVPVSKGGSNAHRNLVTACHPCNTRRGNRDVEVFAEAVAMYINHGVTADDIITRVNELVARPLNVKEAKEIIARRKV